MVGAPLLAREPGDQKHPADWREPCRERRRAGETQGFFDLAARGGEWRGNLGAGRVPPGWAVRDAARLSGEARTPAILSVRTISSGVKRASPAPPARLPPSAAGPHC